MRVSYVLLVINLLFYSLLTGQSVTVQPRILLLPYTQSGQSAIEEYESSFAYRTTLSEIANALNNVGFKPDDLQEILNRIKENEAISSLKGVSFDPVERILQYSTADIIIRAEVYVHTDSNGANSVQINLRAVDKVSSKIMYSMNFDATPHFKTDDFGYLARRALTDKNQITTFVEGLGASFHDVIENGRSVSCIIESTVESRFSLSEELTNDYEMLSDIIIDWVKRTAFKNNFRIRNNSANQLYFDEIRIPWKDESDQNYLPDDYARELRIFLDKELSIYTGERIRIQRPIVNSGVIRIILP